MTRSFAFGSFAAALLVSALLTLPAGAQSMGGPGSGAGGAPSAGGGGGGGGTPPSAGGGTFRGGGPAMGGSGRSGRGYHGGGYRHHGGYYRGPAIVGGWGWGAPYYDNWAYPYYEDYERCYIRRVKYKGRWVRRRYCEY